MKQNLEQSENKYYTPSIEEFRVGFECEIMTSYGYIKGKWPNILHKESLNNFGGDTLELTKKSTIRVKYLDIDDILSLGFEENYKEADIVTNEIYYIDLQKDNINLKYHSWYTKGRKEGEDYYETNRYILCTISKDDKCIFRGFIKNKSELKNLLTQLGIEYNE